MLLNLDMLYFLIDFGSDKKVLNLDMLILNLVISGIFADFNQIGKLPALKEFLGKNYLF